MATGHPEQAIADFDQAIQLQPDFPQAYTNRGNAYLRLGRLGLAMDDFRRRRSNPMSIILYCLIIFTTVVLLGVAWHRRFVLSKKGNQ